MSEWYKGLKYCDSHVVPASISELVGKTFSSVERISSVTKWGERDSDVLRFVSTDGSEYALLHYQDCCESVFIQDICGDLTDLVDTPMCAAEELFGETEPDITFDESYTWTFYRFITIKGTVVVRWLGTSNGYYSESVDFVKKSDVEKTDDVVH